MRLGRTWANIFFLCVSNFVYYKDEHKTHYPSGTIFLKVCASLKRRNEKYFVWTNIAFIQETHINQTNSKCFLKWCISSIETANGGILVCEWLLKEKVNSHFYSGRFTASFNARVRSQKQDLKTAECRGKINPASVVIIDTKLRGFFAPVYHLNR